MSGGSVLRGLPQRQSPVSRWAAVAVVVLALGACGGGSSNEERDAALAREAAALERAGAAEAARDAARERAAAAEAALADAQDALRLATAALSDGGDAGSRQELGQQLRETNERLAAAREDLGSPTDEAGRETVRALELTEAALAAAERALGLVGQVGSGALLAASAHTVLDEALNAVDSAQAQLAVAEEAVDDADSAAGRALRAARGALTSAQVTLLPRVRQELRAAEGNLAEERAVQDKARRDLRAALEGIGVEVADGADLDRLVELARDNLSGTGTRTALREALEAVGVEVAADATLEAVLEQLNGTLRSLSADGAAAARATLIEALGSDADATLGELVDTALMMLRDAGGPVFGMNPEAIGGTATVEHTPRTTGYEIRFYEGFGLAAGGACADSSTGTCTAYQNQTKYSLHEIEGGDVDNYVPGRTQPDPVAYDPGNPAMVLAYNSATRAFAGSTDEFPVRGTVIRGEANALAGAEHPPRPGASPNTGNPPDGIPRLRVQGVDWTDNADAWGNYKHGWEASFRYDAEEGLVMRFGGDGLIYGDLERFAAKGCPTGAANQQCNNPVTNNIEVALGAPSADPLGEPTYYWKLPVPNPKRDLMRDDEGDPVVTLFGEDELPEPGSGYYRYHAGTPASPGTYNRGGRYAHVQLEDGPPKDNPTQGVYEAMLTNYAGIDDDEARHLKYAAYGLFRYIETNTRDVRPGRIQAFHYGLDAMEDGTLAHADGRTDIPAATGESIEASFSGRTMGWKLTSFKTDRDGAHGRSPKIFEMFRMRGDVSLHACIGGTGCGDAFVAALPEFKEAGANRIGGVMENMEYELAPGVWTDRNSGLFVRGRESMRGKIFLGGKDGTNLTGSAVGDVAAGTLAGAAITDGGTFAGAAMPDGREFSYDENRPSAKLPMTHSWSAGGFEGALYGPRDGLEAAGTWHVGARARTETSGTEVQRGVVGMMGSFGAVCENCD